MRRLVRGWVTSAGVLGALALVSGGVPWSMPQADPVQAATASFSVSPPSQTVTEGSGPVTVDVMLNEAAGVSSWEFRLTYNPDVLELEAATADQSYLNSLPGQFCPSAVKDETAGWVQLGCATSGQNSGASGSGKVASITFLPKDSGKSNLLFTDADLSNWLAESIAVTTGSGMIKVAGDGESNSIEPTPTYNPSLLTPTPSGGVPPTPVDPNDPNVTGESSAKTPTPRSGTTSSGSSGSSGSGSSSGGSVQGSTTSGGAGSPSSGASGSGTSGSATGPDGAPVAGAGTLEEQAAWPRYLLVLSGIAGVAMVAGGALMSRGRKDVA